MPFSEADRFYALRDALHHLALEAEPTLNRFSVEDSRDNFARYGLCLVLEVAEFVNELPWKHWGRRESNPESIKEEFADMLAFIGSLVCLMNRSGIDIDDLAAAYLKKTSENRRRFAAYQQNTEGT